MNIDSQTAYFKGALSKGVERGVASVEAIGKSFMEVDSANSRLVKGQLLTYDDKLKVTTSYQVQFNPSEYTITRSSVISKKQAIAAGDTDKLKSITSSSPAVLNLNLYFDTITDLSFHALRSVSASNEAMKSFYSNKSKGGVEDVTDRFINMMFYNKEAHSPVAVCFMWGSMKFIGMMTNNTLRYTMFLPSGVPVRAQMSLTIVGEENSNIDAAMRKKFESPDRTKERVLKECDSLWQLSYKEYDDASKWKVIASENGILNPRKIPVGTQVTVPAL